MNLKKLADDWLTDPTLRYFASDCVTDLAKLLTNAHQYLMSSQAGPLGYLYQQQVRVNRELKEKLHAYEAARADKEGELPPVSGDGVRE